jgi:hemerythrin
MLIDKNDLPLVAMDFMNEVHFEDVDIINSLHDCILKYDIEKSENNFNEVNAKYQEWFEHTVEHFKNEEIKMQEIKFPPYMMHKGEHDTALNTMDEVFRQWSQDKDIYKLKEYFEVHLKPWLVNHIQTMDTVTASFFKTGLSPCSMH